MRGGERVRFLKRSEHYLVVHFGFSEQNSEFVDVLLAFFGGLAQFEDGVLAALRFEPLA